jgi:hypothetical protein
MSPITDRSKAKEGGFAQVRSALLKFKGDVDSAEFGKWGGKLVDDDGKPIAPREFLEIHSVNNEVLEVTEELSMDITAEHTFRENCSDFKGSFWMDKFLESVEKFGILIPEGLIGKRITWEKAVLEAVNKDGTPNPKYNSTNYVIVAVESPSTAKVATKVVTPAVTKATPKTESAEVPAVVAPAIDPMEIAANLAVGKTEAQFKTAISLDPNFANSPLLPLAKAGMITLALVNDKKLIIVEQGNKKVYQKPS